MTHANLFPCKTCKHSATDHSSKTGPRDSACHREDCTCKRYNGWAMDALKSKRR